MCEDGYYGNICNIRCGRCKYGHACDKHNGSCYNGCMSNFQPPQCKGNFHNIVWVLFNDLADCLIDAYTIIVYKIKVCENGFYNANCTGRCGNCQNGQACDKESGNCSNGCSSNFKKPLCQGV